MKRLLTVVLLAVTCSTALAFRIVRDINSAKPLDEKLVLFQKGQKHNLAFTDSDNCKITINADGAIESRLVGNGVVDAKITWPTPFDAKEYDYLLLTCRIEGTINTINSPGKVASNRADNLWIGPTLINAKGERVGTVNLADVADDLKTPASTAALRIPMTLFNNGNDASQVTAMLFHMDKTRPNVDRDLRLVIEKIALAKQQ